MATKGRTPIPKTQRELSVSQQVPLNENGPGFQSVGNPNNSTQLNRGEQVSFNGDTYKPFSVGIQDINEAVYYYFTNVIRPFVIQNGTRIEVPVIYGSPEKWASFQKFGYFRDSQGKIMMPIIMFKRDNIEKVRTVANKLDTNYPNNTTIHRQSYSSKNAYDNFSVLNNVRPEKVKIVDQGKTGLPKNQINGSIKLTAFVGVSTQYEVITNWGQEISAFEQNIDPSDLGRPGQAVTLAWEPRHSFVLDPDQDLTADLLETI